MTESSGHDPLCPTNQNDDPNCWFCEHNAKVRADEREVCSQAFSAGRDDLLRSTAAMQLRMDDEE